MQFRMAAAVVIYGLLGGAISAVYADPPTPPAHSERDYRTIGGGLYVLRNTDLSPDENGNLSVMVFSHQFLNAGGSYSLDIAELNGVPESDLSYDGGTLGVLRAVIVTIDCVHRTYEVIDTAKLLPEPIWRRASTLTVLAPVFRFACTSRFSHVAISQPSALPVTPPQAVATIPDPATIEQRIETCIRSPEMAGQGDTYSKCRARVQGSP